MALKCFVNKLDEVPDPMREFYERTADGRFALVLDGQPAGYVRADKLAEFRDNNRALHTANAGLETRLKVFDGIDPAEHVAMKDKLAHGQDVDLVALSEKHAADVAAAINATKAEHAADLAAHQATLAAELAAERAAHAATQFKSAVGAEFLRSGGRASAVDYMLGLAAKTFAMKDGEVTTTEFSAANPGEPLTVSEWMQAQVAVADFAFLPSRGGGARPNPSGGPVTPARRTVSGDPVEFGQNLAAIASGDVDVIEY